MRRMCFAQKCDKSNSGSLEGSEIKHFYDLLTHREEIDVIYQTYAQTGGQMSDRDLLNFLLNEQREQVTVEAAHKLIEKYEMDGAGRVGCWSLRAFYFTGFNFALHSPLLLPCSSFVLAFCPLSQQSRRGT